MANTYFIGGPRSRRGPFDTQELHEMILDGRLRSDDLVQPEGMDDWQEARDVRELAELFASLRGGAPRSDRRSSGRNDDDDDRPLGRPPGRWDDDDDRGPSIENREVDRALTLRFRREIHALGGFWILIGGLVVAVGLVLLLGGANRNLPGMDPKMDAVTMSLVGGVAASVGVIYLVIGILSCLKKIAAVYVGLVLSYLAVAANLLNLNVCGLVILIVVIVQAHRVIGFAKKMSAADVPLDVKP